MKVAQPSPPELAVRNSQSVCRREEGNLGKSLPRQRGRLPDAPPPLRYAASSRHRNPSLRASTCGSEELHTKVILVGVGIGTQATGTSVTRWVIGAAGEQLLVLATWRRTRVGRRHRRRQDKQRRRPVLPPHPSSSPTL